ncbi:unnamed protein product [Didymodactylos carnosus]|uniref:DUF229 domain containing protein n=1 Tax=Didymodactylos carnosus TaxID=1234261 RepID=A0A813UFA0_9BILA|nr:unnamed protein product [Didymodactylos carnosus]CAF3613738.1 unnamed protein product [Didymodactylos carnosus]
MIRRCLRYSKYRYTALFSLVTCTLFLLMYTSFSNVLRHLSYGRFYVYSDYDEQTLVDESDLVESKRQQPQIILPNIQLLKEDYFNLSHLTCKNPKLDIDSPDIWKYLQPVKGDLECEKTHNWVYIENGTFRLSQQALHKHGPIVCAYRPILRGKDDFSTVEGQRLFPVVDKMPLVSDFFRADCRARDGSIYSNIHSGIQFDAGLHMRHIWNPMVKTHLGYNVLMFGFDSISRMTFMRLLPKTYSYLIQQLGAVVMKGYNIVGDGTPAALLPILTSQTEMELPESRRGHEGAQTVDRYPWIWNKFKDNGYVTQWGEDGQSVGTFQMRLLGFRDPPVDHYMRPFFLVAESMRTTKPYCFGSVSRHQNMLNWMREFFEMYPIQPKFSFLFHSQYSHDTNNRLPYADRELHDFLVHMNTKGYLDNTMLIIMTDHGARYSQLRKSYQGKLEERLPFMSIRMPPIFHKRYPHLIRNLRLNSHRLTTPFDIHETFLNLFNFQDDSDYRPKSNRSYSLFHPIPDNRTCESAAVESHWCACLQWTPIVDYQTRPLIQKISQAVVDYLNSYLSDVRNECAQLKLFQVHKAQELAANDMMLKFVKSIDKDGRVPGFNPQSNITVEKQVRKDQRMPLYQLQLETIPGHGQFEITVGHDVLQETFDIQKRRLSRINKYGRDSECIARKRPEFREICYCDKFVTNKKRISV